MSEQPTTTPQVVPQLTLGWRLQLALHHADMKVQDMADYLGVTRSTLSRWMNDHGTPPRPAFTMQWALRCGVPHAWLRNGTESGPDLGEHASPWITRLAAA